VRILPLSGSTDGKGILISDTATPGQTIHTVPKGSVDRIFLWAFISNSGASSTLLSIELGGTGDANTIEETIVVDAKPEKILMPEAGEGYWLFANSAAITVAAFAATTNLISVLGYVERNP